MEVFSNMAHMLVWGDTILNCLLYLSSVYIARQNTSEVADTAKKQLVAIQEKHKGELDMIKKQLTEMRKETQKLNSMVGHFDLTHAPGRLAINVTLWF